MITVIKSQEIKKIKINVIIQNCKECVVTRAIDRKYSYSTIFYGLKALVCLEYLIVEDP
jgi:hypothetical protein